MQLTYCVRAYPTKRQHGLLTDYLDHTRLLYNAALQERIDCYEKTGRTISNAEQARELTELRAEPQYARYPRRMQRWAINLVETNYRGMFARHRKGEKLGRPKFRSRFFWSTVGWDSPTDFRMRERGIFNRALGGTLRLRPDRDLPEFSTCTVFKLCRDDGDRWFAHLTYDVPDVAQVEEPGRPVGIDIGLKTLVVRSDGVPMQTERASKEDVAEQRRAGRALSRCKRRSKRRMKVRARLRQVNKRIARKRKADLQVISARLTHHFDAVAVEDLNVAGLNKGGGGGASGRGIRKSWRDRAPGMLLEMLRWKSQRDGRPFKEVDPRYTSILCSSCGAEVPKTLRDRTHNCECGVVLDRDHNAALNILTRAGWGPGGAKPGSDRPMVDRRAGLPLKHGKDRRTTASTRSRVAPSILPTSEREHALGP